MQSWEIITNPTVTRLTYISHSSYLYIICIFRIAISQSGLNCGEDINKHVNVPACAPLTRKHIWLCSNPFCECLNQFTMWTQAVIVKHTHTNTHTAFFHTYTHTRGYAHMCYSAHPSILYEDCCVLTSPLWCWSALVYCCGQQGGGWNPPAEQRMTSAARCAIPPLTCPDQMQGFLTKSKHYPLWSYVYITIAI